MPGTSSWYAKQGVNKGAWTSEEDEILRNYVKIHGEGRWRTAAKNAGLNRCAKSCRLRWLNYLRPGIKRGNITIDEEDLIIRLHRLLGNRWSLIAGRLPGRTDNEIKNYWNTTVVKKMKKTRSSSSSLLSDSHDSEYEENNEKNTNRNDNSMNAKESLSDPSNEAPLSRSCGLLSASPINVDQECSLNNSNGEGFISSTLFGDNMDGDDMISFLDGTTDDGEGLRSGGFVSDSELIWLEIARENCMSVSNLPSANESSSSREHVKEEQGLKYDSYEGDVALPLDAELKKLESFLDLDEEWREE